MAFLSIPYFNSIADDVDTDPFHLLTPRHPHNSLLQNREHSSNLVRNFSPRFDVRESKDAYHLDGELPGIDQKDIEIEFSDPHTMIVKGHSTRSYEHSSADDDDVDGKTVATTNSTRDATVKDKNNDDNAAQDDKSTSKPQYKYWVSERSSGSFHRTFNFPAEVNQDAVKASMKNGVLAVHIPKQLTNKPLRKIQID